MPNPELAARVKELKQSGNLEVQGAMIAVGGLIADFYEQRAYTPAFDDKKIRDLMVGIERMQAHGLTPDDYHRRVLKELRDRPQPLSARARADLELLLMDAFLRMAYHRAYGKVNPTTLDPNWNFERPLITSDPLRELALTMDSASPVSHLDALLPEPDFYRDLKGALARYRTLAASGGWPRIDSGPALKPGMTDPRLSAIRARLRVTGDLAASDPQDPVLFDDDLKQAVERFQRRHGLAADGVIGPSTLAAMNMPVTSRIDQIRVNLERARWVQRDLPPDFVLVNIAGFRVYLVRGGEVTWSARVQVGKTYRETPVFRDTIEYVVFNPTWTVPPGILRKDIIPQARKNPDIIRRKGLKVLDRDGTEVDPRAVNWSAEGFPYVLRQDPGPSNALGRVKLMFPNEHLVYLHDTPSKDLFERSQRTASSGCIRVERPLELTELVLSGTESWDRTRIDQVIASKRTTRVDLARPMPVLILYWTAEVLEDASVTFRDDVYGRDAPVLSALNGKFAFSPPKRPPSAAPPGEQPAAGGWVVQVASLTSAAGAQRLVLELREQGFSAFITRSQVEGKAYHRVRLGPLASRREADTMVESLRMNTGYQGQALRR
ncbi:MAG: L,D-transpeptidase family protein [Pseudomonadota bacterium]|nr:L,D-transpeptidase family protein [Pseudomonadota bacterium]